MSLSGCNILVLEDELLVAFDLADELADRGAAPALAHSVAEGLFFLKTTKPDAAVLDINLGADLCWPVAEKLTADGVPFFLVSGWQMMGRIPSGVEPEACLEKPVAAHDLVDRLMAVVRPAALSGHQGHFRPILQ